MATELTGADDHLYAVLRTDLSQKQVADLYQPPEWHARTWSWFDYEVCCSWAELCLEGQAIPRTSNVRPGEILMRDQSPTLPKTPSKFSARCERPVSASPADFYALGKDVDTEVVF